MNFANKITILRILLIPFFIAFILYSKWELALLVFIIAALTDAIDGYIARALKQRTELGKILDPIADKLIILSAFICLSVSKTLPPALKPPVYVPIIVISRDAIIILGALLIHHIKGELNIMPTLISKITTFLQMATVISILLGSAAVSPLLWSITVGFTIVSGIDYIAKGSKLLNEK
ncbi:MAG: CDP-alcohol phosphatidyltransferase family protein [Candidatus Omnitrophica bacterium]|nr:CDP-alcohol phosphatidyltransferase family protein [Candidatus Omnitrophota bacterium]